MGLKQFYSYGGMSGLNGRVLMAVNAMCFNESNQQVIIKCKHKREFQPLEANTGYISHLSVSGLPTIQSIESFLLQGVSQSSATLINHSFCNLSSCDFSIYNFEVAFFSFFSNDYNFYITNSMISNKPIAPTSTFPSTLQKTKSPPRLQNYEDKLQATLQLNTKLKDLLQAMRSNALARKIEMNQTSSNVGDDQHILKLRRREGKLTSELQQLTNNLNVLVSQNAKLKSQVDVSRNSRVIYSNVYKTIEKEIRKHQYLYKLAIIDYLCYEEVEKKAKDRIHKTARRLQKDIGQLEGSAKPLRKKDKRKSRLDTGLSSYRMESKDTCRASNEDPKTARQDHNPSVRETAISKRDAPHRISSQKIQAALMASHRKQEKIQNEHVERHEKEKAIRSRGRILTEKFDDYYDLEMKSNYYDNLMKHLREITGQEDLKSIVSDWQQADSQVENQYASYLQLEQQAKALREEREALERQLQRRSQKEIEGGKTIQEDELSQVEKQLQAERQRLASLEEKLTSIIDINSSKLTDEEITQHVQRIKRRGDTSARQLEKLLESVNKEKNQSVGASRVTNKSKQSRIV